MDIGNRIKELRKSMNISSTQLAKKIDVSQSTISKLENNSRKADFEIIEKICIALNLSLKDFFDFDNQSDPNLLKLITYAKKLNPEQLEKLSEFIKSLH